MAISGVRTQKLPLTLRSLLFAAVWANMELPNSVFGSVSQDTHRQALTGLSWLSYSRPLDLPTVPEYGQSQTRRPAARSIRCIKQQDLTSRTQSPVRHGPGFDCHQPKAPHAGTRSTNLPFRSGPKPVGGFAASNGRSPTLIHDGPDAKASGSFRIAPIPRAAREPAAREQLLSDRTLRLISDIQSQRVYFNEPPSSTDKRVSTHPALLAQHVMVGEAIPLACWLQVYRVCCPIERSHAAR